MKVKASVKKRSEDCKIVKRKGRVYVIGITSKQDQLDSVIKVVRTIKGVKEIVNYVIINEG